MKLKWLTGTVREILEKGCSYIIERPKQKAVQEKQSSLEANIS